MGAGASYSVDWDMPHLPGDDAAWQESDCYWFYDAQTGVGGFHRIGQRPNSGLGQLTLFVFRRDGERFVMSAGPRTSVPLRDDARQPMRQMVGTHFAESLGDGRMRYGWNEPETAAELEFHENFYPPQNWPETELSREYRAAVCSDGHLECGGRLRGTVRIGGASYRIDALAHRDRSWGVRQHLAVSMHRYRMFSGTCGAELSFAGFLLDLADGSPMVMGYVSRNDVVEPIVGLRVPVTFDYDGLTPLGAEGILTLASGERLRLQVRPVQGFMTPVEGTGFVSQDSIATFEYGGRTGFLDLELSTNPQRGSYLPKQADVTFLAVDQGLSSAADYQL